MPVDWNLLFTALGLAFVIEGIPYLLFADKLPPLLRSLAESPTMLLRVFGVSAILLGLAVIAACRLLSA